jgi:acyl-CoA synthetase (AMP-forming)/AMP-acid ligase II
MKHFTICYGMTETSPVTFQTFPDGSDELRTTTIGFPSAHTEVKVINEAGQIVPVGVPGELCTRGYSTMLGYWNDKEKTDELITPDRWLHSG